MEFLSPLWLIGLLPWLALLAWLMFGRREMQPVPFLSLWRGPAAGPSERRSIRVPPIPVIAVLAAMLLAILAAADPVVTDPARGPEISIVLDRGATMSAGGEKDFRFRELVESSRGLIGRKFGFGPVNLIAIPGEKVRTDRSDWPSQASKLPPTALPTATLVNDAVGRLLAETGDPVIVLSDQAITPKDPRIFQLAPTTQPGNVGVARVAARARPTTSLLVRLRNQSDATSTKIDVKAAESTVTRDVQLPPRDGERDYFFELPDSADVVEVSIAGNGDAMPADDRAWLVRRFSWPVMESRGNLPDAMRQMIRAYAKSRRSDGGSKSIGVATVSSDVDSGGSQVLLGAAGTQLPLDARELIVTDHAITRSVDWASLGDAVSVAGEPPVGFTPLVKLGERVLVAIEHDPVRKTWVGFDSANWAKTPAYVVFWTNVFDWTGEGGEEFASETVHQLPAEWKVQSPTTVPSGAAAGLWPGLYTDARGNVRAINPADVRVGPAIGSDGRARLESLRVKTGGQRNVSEAFTLAAMACLIVAAIAWPRWWQRSGPDGGLTAFSDARSVKPNA